MEKPPVVKWISRIFLIRLLVYAISLGICALALYVLQGQGFISEIADVIFAQRKVQSPYLNPGYAIGYLIGSLGYTSFLILLQYIFLARKKKVGFWIVLILDLLTTLARFRLPIFQLIVLILMLNKRTAAYLRKEVRT